ncbi:MAG: DUF885 family protein [Polyangiales bacterium]
MTRPWFAGRPRALLALAATLIGCGGSVGRGASRAREQASIQLATLIAEAERLERDVDPITAAQDGDTAALALLPDVRPEALDAFAARRKALLAALARIDVRALSEAEALDHRLLTDANQIALEGHALDLPRLAFQSDEGFHTLGDYLAGTSTLRDAADAEAWLTRIAALPAFYAQNVDNLRRGVATGFTQPRLVIERVLAVARAQAALAPAESPLLAPLRALPPRGAARAQRLARGEASIRDAVLPAQRSFAAFLADTYLPAARPALGARTLPNGEAVYRFLVRRETTTALTPDEVHAIGTREVARIRARMDDTVARTGFRGSFAEFLHFLRSDARFYAESAERLLERASALAKRADESLPRVFGTLPRLPYGVRPVPAELAEGYTSGRYWPGSPKLGQAAAYLVNTAHLDQRPLYELPALTLHEAVPGHHLQIALAQELDGLPYFRRNAAPTAYVEGWALYAESLGEELGLYADPYALFGRLSFEMWRACRLVADVAIHWRGASLEEARSCFTDNSALAPHNIETELERYVSWPAQALAYKLGELRIVSLRRAAEAKLGARFDVRAFHDAVLLGGALPLDVLEARVHAFIARAL